MKSEKLIKVFMNKKTRQFSIPLSKKMISALPERLRPGEQLFLKFKEKFEFIRRAGKWQKK